MRSWGIVLLLLASATAFAQTAPRAASTPAPPVHQINAQDLKFYADIATKAALTAENAKKEAIVNAKMYLQCAEMHVRQQLMANADYKAASQSVDTAQRVLNEARTLGNPQLQVDASSQFNRASERVKQLEDGAIASDIDVRAARALLQQLDPALAPPPQPQLQTATAGSPGQNATAMGQGSATVTGAGAQANAQQQQHPTRKARPTTIEIGMTRDELQTFLRFNTTHYKVIAYSSRRPVGMSTVQTTTQQQGISATATNGGPAVTQSGQSDSTVTRQTKTIGAKTEFVEIAVLQARDVVVGSHRNVLGGTSYDHETQMLQAGRIYITLVDDVVTEMESH